MRRLLLCTVWWLTRATCATVCVSVHVRSACTLLLPYICWSGLPVCVAYRPVRQPGGVQHLCPAAHFDRLSGVLSEILLLVSDVSTRHPFIAVFRASSDRSMLAVSVSECESIKQSMLVAMQTAIQTDQLTVADQVADIRRMMADSHQLMESLTAARAAHRQQEVMMTRLSCSTSTRTSSASMADSCRARDSSASTPSTDGLHMASRYNSRQRPARLRQPPPPHHRPLHLPSAVHPPPPASSAEGCARDRQELHVCGAADGDECERAGGASVST